MVGQNTKTNKVDNAYSCIMELQHPEHTTPSIKHTYRTTIFCDGLLKRGIPSHPSSKNSLVDSILQFVTLSAQLVTLGSSNARESA